MSDNDSLDDDPAVDVRALLCEVFEKPAPEPNRKRTERNDGDHDTKRTRQPRETDAADMDDSEDDDTEAMPTCSSSEPAKRATRSSSSSSSSSSSAPAKEKPKRVRKPREHPAGTKIAFAERTEADITETIYFGCKPGVPYPIDAPSGHNTVKIIIPSDGNRAVVMPANLVWKSMSVFRLMEDLKKAFESSVSAVASTITDLAADPKCLVITLPAGSMVEDAVAADGKTKRATKKDMASVAAIKLIYKLIRYGKNRDRAARGETIKDFDKKLKDGLVFETCMAIMDFLNPEKQPSADEEEPVTVPSSTSSSSSSSSSAAPADVPIPM
jgi:hypothetical protein